MSAAEKVVVTKAPQAIDADLVMWFREGGGSRGGFRDRGYRVVASSRTHSAETLGFLATLHPVGRMGMVEEIAAGVLYVDTAACVSGEALHVDGVLMPVTGKHRSMTNSRVLEE